MENKDSRFGMDFWGHLAELRARLIKSAAAILLGMVASYGWIEPRLFNLALQPLGQRKLMYLSISEAFMTHILLALYIGIVLALPVVAYQIWAFVSPGLYKKERRIALGLSLASCSLFVTGVLFAWFLLLPVVVEFFLSFESENLFYGGALGSYLRMVAGILFGAGAAFQLPMVLLALMKSGIVTREEMAAKREYWVLAIALLAAVLTPTGDLVTLLLMAAPMWILFEGALIVGRFIGVRQ